MSAGMREKVYTLGVAAEAEASFMVFAQRSDARFDVNLISGQARRFFASELGLTADKSYPDVPPVVDEVRVVVAGPEGNSGVRLCYARPTTAKDLEIAASAEMRVTYTGLSGLAKRCGYVWLVSSEGPEDRAALLIAAILASVYLGPILSPDANELFGVKTARLKLERARG
jgi:hypothetical protein